MARELEIELLQSLVAGQVPREVTARWLASGRIESPKQVWRTLEKWSTKGWYDYGVAIDLGWLTPTGIERAGLPN